MRKAVSTMFTLKGRKYNMTRLIVGNSGSGKSSKVFELIAKDLASAGPKILLLTGEYSEEYAMSQITEYTWERDMGNLYIYTDPWAPDISGLVRAMLQCDTEKIYVDGFKLTPSDLKLLDVIACHKRADMYVTIQSNKGNTRDIQIVDYKGDNING